MRVWPLIVSLMLISVLLNFGITPTNSLSEPTPLDPEQVTFTNVTNQAGLGGVGGNFLAWGDYNNDGYQDLLVNGGRLFRNNGPPNWNFTDVSGEAGISGGSHGTWADWNNDGYLDFYTAGSDTLYRNNGPPNWDFTDVTTQAGILRESHSTGSGWGDYDNDGDVDLFKIRGEEGSTYFPNSFWRNNGDNTFTNVTVEAGVDEYSNPKYSRGVAWADYNDDGWLDIYISNYRLLPNYLYHNNGDGTFTEVAAEKGVEGHRTDMYGGTYYGHSVGACWGDINNDGYLDLWVTNLAHKDLYRGPICDDSYLFLNNGPSEYAFTDIRSSSGIPIKPLGGSAQDGDELFVGCAWGDYDNDGYIDLYIPQIYGDVSYAYSYLYRNDGDLTFTDVTEEAGVRVWDTYAGCWCDYNNDGMLDLITAGKYPYENGEYEIRLFRNNGNSGNWIHLNLKGDGVYSNTAAIGARVVLTTDEGDRQIKEVEGGMGCHGHQNSFTLEFGLGDYSGTVDIEIRWPHGKIQFIEDVDINQVVNISDESIGDIILVDVAFNNSDPIMGEEVRISATVGNSGSTVINTAEVRFYLDRIEEANQILPTRILTDIYPDEEQTANVDWDTTGISGFHTVYVKAEITDPQPPGRPSIMSGNTFIRSENALPTAVLSAYPTTIEKGESVFFDASNSTDDTSVTEYYFDFGDGNTSDWISEATITHLFQYGGDYNASLKVRDDDNGESKNTAEIIIDVRAKPTAVLTAAPTLIYKEESVTFNASQSSDEGGTIDEYNFDFGDGKSTGWVKNPLVTHVYSAVGNFNASLKVMDDDEEVSENLAEVVIEVRAKPVAVLTAAPTSIYKGENVTFNASQSSDDGGTIEAYNFDFGDGGSTDWVQNPLATHVYSVVGNYNASLKVMDNDGDINENTEEVVIEVRAKPIAVLSANPTQIYEGDSVIFDASQSSDEGGTIAAYYFDYGDGSVSGWTKQSTKTHRYSSANIYTVSLKVKDDDGDISINKAEVKITVNEIPNQIPTATIDSILPNPVTVGNKVTLSGHGEDEDGDIIAYQWRSDIDGELSVFQSFSTSGLSIGNHTIYFKVQDDSQAWSIEVHEILVVKALNVKPVLEMVTPRDNEITSGRINIIGNAEDPDGEVESVEISIDGGSWETAEGTTYWSYELDTTELVDGEHTISIRAFDGEEYSEELGITIIIDQEMGKDKGTEPDLFFILVVVLIVVFVVALALAVSLSSKKKGM